MAFTRPLLFAHALLSAPVLAQNFPNIRLDVGSPPGTSQSDEVHVAAAGSSVYAVWRDYRASSTQPELYFNRSLNAGATWLANDMRINDASVSNFPREVRIEAEGSSVYVIWQDARVFGSRYIYSNRSLDAGATWLPNDVRVNVGTQEVLGSQLAASGSSVYVVWEDPRNEGSGIFFNRSLDSGATWLTDDVRIDVSGLGSFSTNAQIAAVGTSVYVTWTDLRAGQFGIYFNRSLDSGSTWLPEDVRIDISSSGTASSREPQIAAAGSSVYVAWSRTDGSALDVFFNRSLDSGTTWLTDDVRLNVGTPPGAFSATDVRIAASGPSVYCTWNDRRGGPSSVYFNRSLDSGLSWLPYDVEILHCPGPSALAVSGSFVGVNCSTLFNCTTDAGTTWLPMEIRVDTGGATQTIDPADLAVGASSTYVVWADDRNGEDDIFFALPIGHQPYGPGTPGAGGLMPQLSATGEPGIGTTFSLELANGLGGAGALILYGLGGKASVPALGGMLLVQPPVFRLSTVLGGTSGVSGVGSVALPIAIPNDISLLGLRVNSQGGVFDSAAQGGIALTGGLETWVL